MLKNSDFGCCITIPFFVAHHAPGGPHFNIVTVNLKKIDNKLLPS